MKKYLGDSVYIDIENGMIKLTTNNGYHDEGTIYMDSAVIANFQQYLKDLNK